MRLLVLLFFVLFINPLFADSPGDTLTLRINFVILQKADGTGNFDTTDHKQMKYLDDAVMRLNEAYAYAHRRFIDSSCLETCGYDDSGIRFRHHKTIVIRSDSLWNNDLDINWQKCPSRKRWLWLKLQRHLDTTIAPEDKGINVYFTVSERQYKIQNTVENYNYEGFLQSACSMYPSEDTTEFSAIHHPNAFLKYRFMQNHPYNWGIGSLGRGIAHELGHSLGLKHDFDCLNIMDNHGSKGRTGLQDYQVDIAREKIMTTNLIQYLDP